MQKPSSGTTYFVKDSELDGHSPHTTGKSLLSLCPQIPFELRYDAFDIDQKPVGIASPISTQTIFENSAK